MGIEFPPATIPAFLCSLGGEGMDIFWTRQRNGVRGKKV